MAVAAKEMTRRVGETAGAHVIVGVDASLAGLQTLREAVRLARGLGAVLRAVRAWENPPGAEAGWGPGVLWPAPPAGSQWEARETAGRNYIRRVFAEAPRRAAG
jgi:nucleotide-binding universal stress UspA family protein